MAEISYQVYQKPIEQRLIDAACIYWEIPRSALMVNSKVEYAYIKRSIVCYLIENNTTMNKKEIGKLFGLASHSNVVKAVETIDLLKNRDRQIRDALNQIQYISGTLDAEFITISASLVNKKLQING